MRTLLPLALLLATAACVDEVAEDLAGELVQVEVLGLADGCDPARHLGDGGLQFHGVRPDGGVLLSLAATVQYGPLPDGGPLEGTALSQVPNPAAVATVGSEADCQATVGLLVPTDGGIRLEQDLPGALTCPSGPLWLPRVRCGSARLLRLTPVRACHLRCVRLGASGDVGCDC